MITVYTKTVCGFCGVAKRWLESNGFEYNEVNIEHDEKARDMIVGLGYKIFFTQIFYNGKVLVEGGAEGLKRETKETIPRKIDACPKQI